MATQPVKCFVWLASYPKSGNTWLRIFLANYIINPPEPVSINRLSSIALGDALMRFYKRVDPSLDPSDENRALMAREPMLRAMITDPSSVQFLKTHFINHTLNGFEVIPAALTRQAIYVVRNPLDMAVSYGNHYGLDHSTTARAIGSPHNRVTPGEGTVTQYLGTWSDHVASWTRHAAFPVHVVKYEDMLANPRKTFTQVIRALKMPFDKERLAKAIDFSTFDRLQKQEATEGFIERSEKSERFFRAGTSGQWQDALDQDVVDQIVADHGRMMRKYGYTPG